MLEIMPNSYLSLKEMPGTFKIWPKWRNFAKSGHTIGLGVHRCPLTSRRLRFVGVANKQRAYSTSKAQLRE